MPNESLLQLPKLFFESVCHAGLDPWLNRPFDRLTVLSEPVESLKVERVEGLTTLSNVEGEPIAVSTSYVSGCRIKSGMTRSSFLQKL
jgi:hypothetical protein